MPKAEETRSLIIEKTASLFNRKGFVGTTLSDMEHATGLTKGSIYNNFSNKDEVALAAFDHNLKAVNTLIEKEMGKHSRPIDQLMAYVTVYSQNIFSTPFPAGGCPILNTAVEADDTHPDLRKKATDAIMAWKNTIVRIIQRGIKDKSLRSDIDPEEIAFTLVATIEGAVMISKTTGKTTHLKTVMRFVKEMINNLA